MLEYVKVSPGKNKVIHITDNSFKSNLFYMEIKDHICNVENYTYYALEVFKIINIADLIDYTKPSMTFILREYDTTIAVYINDYTHYKNYYISPEVHEKCKSIAKRKLKMESII